VYLLDTNIWLERLLGQAQSAVVGELLALLPTEQILMTDFTLHSIGVILNRCRQRTTFTVFVQDVIIDGRVAVVSLPPNAMARVVALMDQFGLDFDDAYQYSAAERENVAIISFDTHFDQTERGRQLPAHLLTILRRAEP